SKINDLECNVTCNDVLCESVLSKLDVINFSLCSKINNIESLLEECCHITLSTDIDCCESILSKIDTIPNCCSLIERSCFSLESKLDNLVIPDCCSQIDVIDIRTESILSKLCTIDFTNVTVCSKIAACIGIPNLPGMICD